MPSTYTLNNGIELIGTGEQSGTWGDTTNTNLELLDTALDGQVTVTLASAGTSGSPNDLPISDGAASDGRNRMVIFDDGADLGATAYVQLTPNDAEKIIYVRNDLSGSRSIILFQGTYSASNDYEVPAGTTAVVYFDGAGSGAVAANVFNNAYFDSLRLGSVSVTAILDEDDMSSDSATSLATQQSIKAYVDTQVGANNELSEVLANGNTTGGTDIAVSTGDDITFADSSKAIFGAGNDIQVYHDATNSYLQNYTGNLYVQNYSDDKQIQIATDNGSGGLAAYFLANGNDGSVTLYNYGNAKLATTSSGVDITGTAVTDGLTSSGVLSVDGTVTGNIASFINDGNSTNAKGIKIQGGTDNGFGENYKIEFFDGDGTASGRISTNTGSINIEAAPVTINEAGSDLDFRVESDSNDNMLFVDAGANHVNIGGSTDLGGVLNVNGNLSLAGNSGGNRYVALLGETSTYTGTLMLQAGGGSSGFGGAISMYGHSHASYPGMVFIGSSSGSGGKVVIGTTGNAYADSSQQITAYTDDSEVVINEASKNLDFRVETNNSSATLFVDGQYDGVGIHTTTPISYANAQAVLFIEDNTNPAIALSDTGQAKDWYMVAQGTGLNFNYADGSNTSSASNVTSVMSLYNDANGVVFNEGGLDRDFRVESDGLSHMFAIDAELNTVFIGENDPYEYSGLQIKSNNKWLSVRSNVGNGGVFAQPPVPSNGSGLALGWNGSNGVGEGNIVGAHDSGLGGGLRFHDYDSGTGTYTEMLRLTDTETLFNESGADMDFRVESEGLSHALFVDAANNGVGIGSSSTLSNGLMIRSTTSSTNSIDQKLYLTARSSGTTTTGFGPGITFAGDRNGDGQIQAMAKINAIAEVNSGTTLSSGLQFMSASAGVTAEAMRINRDGAVAINSTGYVKTSNPQHMTIGSGTNANSAGLDIVRGEALGGGTGPIIKMFHGPDSGTQAEIRLASLNGDLLLSADHQNVTSGSEIYFYIDGSRKVLLNGSGEFVFDNSGSGLQFNGRSSTFDDYEEGTWTPRCAVEGQGNMTLGDPKGYYVKVGNVVTAVMNTGTISSVPNPSSTRAWEIRDFPFTTKQTPSIVQTAAVRITNLNANADNGYQCFLYSNDNYGRVEVRTATSGQNSSLFADGANLQITYTYITN